jgi:hypothetical protein
MSEANVVSPSDDRRGFDAVVINRYPNGRDFVAICGDSMSMRVLKMAYRKHVRDDDEIGWDELADALANVLAQTMGDDKFCEWIEGL